MSQRHRRIAVATAVLVGITIGPAVAGEKPKPSPKADARPAVTQSATTPVGTSKAPASDYAAAAKERKAAIDAINAAFAEAVKTAQRVFKAARKAATTAGMKATAETARDKAINDAAAARQAAIKALRPLPMKPVAPATEAPSAP